jgi:hypothetical protein
MHFYSIIECMRFHTRLEYPTRDFRVLQPDWSLNSLRGVTPPSFFATIERYMRNWGFQYFLVSFLNSYEMKPLVEALIKKIGDMYDVQFGTALSDREFHISGKDSDLSRGLDLLFADVFPSALLNQPPDRRSLVENTDICLLLTDPRNSLQRVGIFGEVEGHHGEYLRRRSYWSDKNNLYSVFAIGVMPEEGRGIYLETRTFNGVDRVLITIQAQHPVASDFRLALHWIQQLFNNGPALRCEIWDNELSYFVDLIKKNWHVPTSELMRTLRTYIARGDVVESEPGPTSLIVNLQS